MDKQEFVSALQKGLGRAFMYVRDNGDKYLQPEILNACLHYIGYDPQSEGTRGLWMMDIIRLTENPEFYYNEIINGYLENHNFWDVSQLSTMLRILAQEEGLLKAGELLYQKFDELEFTKSNHPKLNQSRAVGFEIASLDGVDGILHVANIIGSRIRNEPDYQEDIYMYHMFRNQWSEYNIEEVLKKASETNANIKAYIDNATEADKRLYSDKPRIPLQEFLDFIKEKTDIDGKITISRFARRARREDIQEVYKKMLAETQPESLENYFHFFKKVEMPDIPETMLHIFDSTDDTLRYDFIQALGLIKNNFLRELGWHLINQKRMEGLNLLRNNFAEGDWEEITKKLHPITDEYKAHRAALDLGAIYTNKNLSH